MSDPFRPTPAVSNDPFRPTGDPFRPGADDERRTEDALRKTKRSWFGNLRRAFQRSEIDDDLWDEVEETLLAADAGVETTSALVERIRRRVEKERLKNPDEAYEALRDELVALLERPEGEGALWPDDPAGWPRPAIVLVVGVNGTGKTTSIGKLAHAYTRDGKQVIIAAGDTFRAAAIDQLQEWGSRAGADVVGHQPGADPGAVVFDALEAAEARDAGIVIVDTAGRLHNKKHLMDELAKVNRIIQRKYPDAPHEVMLVLDAATGQNGLLQARTFAESVGVTSVFLTKLDGTSKGGIVFAVADELGIPVRFVGTGEGIEDFAPFEPAAFVEALLGE
ncbi:MAG: signal recognition particle-docking protein FtsY [Dehalococcoidia bacterium]|nr:signal recognition particle-docking protein FtsY [Dehalococcoidia bacterium]